MAAPHHIVETTTASAAAKAADAVDRAGGRLCLELSAADRRRSRRRSLDLWVQRYGLQHHSHRQTQHLPHPVSRLGRDSHRGSFELEQAFPLHCSFFLFCFSVLPFPTNVFFPLLSGVPCGP